MKIADDRPAGYQYFEILSDHLADDLTKVFNGELIYPRQIEVHLPADHKTACNFHCPYCQGRLLKQPVARWETTALSLMGKLSGKISYYTFGGAYTEPMRNVYLMAFVAMANRCGAYFGIHTNGSMLTTLEASQGWITELCELSQGSQDYLTISLDAGFPQSHSLTKGLKRDYFTDIIKGIEMAVAIRGDRQGPSIRVCYLMNATNSSTEEIQNIIRIAKGLKLDSLRFSIPYARYGQDFRLVRKYKHDVELKQHEEYEARLKPLMSKCVDEKPYIFYLPPQSQDVDEMIFRQCIYSYIQITLAADGYVYRCSSTASPSFRGHRLGKITDDLGEFNKMVLTNHNPDWDATKGCWAVGARCNRMALEINTRWRDRNDV